MKIIRHTARDMRQALRAVREQLGEDAVILSSRRTGEGVEVTAAVDFAAATLDGRGFANAAAPLRGDLAPRCERFERRAPARRRTQSDAGVHTCDSRLRNCIAGRRGTFAR